MSSTAASSRCAATSLAFSLTLRVARISAAPPTAVVRLPYVPHPIGVVSVSPWNDFDVVDADADLAGDELREGGFFALTVRRGADEDVHLAGGMDADDRALPESALKADRAGDLRRTQAADLDVGADADADQIVPAARAACCSFLSSSYFTWSSSFCSEA